MSTASSYRKLKKLGKGSFGSVFLVQPTAGGEPLVMKEVSLRGLGRKDRQSTINEVSILKKVVHPNVIAYRDSFQTADLLCICMEHAPGGDLTALISAKRRSGERFTEVWPPPAPTPVAAAVLAHRPLSQTATTRAHHRRFTEAGRCHPRPPPPPPAPAAADGTHPPPQAVVAYELTLTLTLTRSWC